MKKAVKRILLLLVAALFLVSAFATLVFASEDVGMTFSSSVNDKWAVRKHLEDAPYTFETWIKVPTGVNTSSNRDARIGSIFSNYDGGSTNTYYDTEQKVASNNTISFEVHSNGVPRLFYGYKNSKNELKSNDVKFSNVNVVTGEWVHLAIVLDVNGGDVICYLNGEEAERKEGIAYDYATDNLLQRFALGQENRASGIIEFLGSIRSLALYRDARTASDIKAAYEKGVDRDDPNLILCYNIPSAPSGNYIEDVSGNGYYAALPTFVSSIEKENATGKAAVLAVGTGSLGAGPVADPVLAENDNGFSFTSGDNYDMEAAITPNGAMTFEAITTLPANDSTSAHNWIIGNWEKWDNPNKALGVQFAANRNVEVFIALGKKSTNSSRYQFALPEIKEGDPLYRRLTVSFTEDGYISCYLDGEQIGEAQKVTHTMGENPGEFFNQTTPFRLGGDYRSNNTSPLKGIKVKSIAMYKGVPKAGTSSTEGLDAMFSYDLTNTSVSGCFADLSGNGNDAIDKNKYDESLKYDYAFAIVGDTQYMTRWDVALDANGNQSTTQHLKQVYDWLLANKDKKNIQYVMGLGDITDSLNKTYGSGSISDTAAEWKIAYEQISRMNGILSYSLARGNHDNSYFFNQYFNESVYRSQFCDPDYPNDNSVCFYSQTDIANAYTKFNVGNEKYLLLILDDKPTDAVVAWANEVIARNGDFRVIINTHTYMGYTGDLIDSTKSEWLYATGNANIANGDARNDGKELWDNLISQHENIALVLCGHDYKTNGDIVRTVRIGKNGNAVNEMLICPQSLDGDSQKDIKKGMVAMLYFSNGGKDIRVEYVSTAESNASADGNDVYRKPEKNNIKITLMELPVASKYGYVYPEYADADKYPFAVFTESGKFLGGFESFLDITPNASGNYNDGGAIYAAKAYLGANAWNSEKGSYGDNPKSALILMRRDFSMYSNETYENIAHVEGTVTIDLDGHTLTLNDAKPMFPNSIKAMSGAVDFETRFDVIDGSIVIGASPLITFSVSSTGDLSKKPYIHNFTNVNFIASSNSANVFFNNKSSYVANPTITFNGCVFNLEDAPIGATVFNLSNGYVNDNVTVNGGEFIFGSNEVNLVSGTTGSLTFGKTDTVGYTTFTAPSGVNLPVASVNGGSLVFVELSTDGGKVTYGLRPKELTSLEFTPKTSITLDRDLVMNVYIPTEILIDFTVGGGESVSKADIKPENIRIIDGKEYCLVSVPLFAWEAAKTVKLTATVSVGENTARGSFYFSVPEYARAIIEGGSDGEAKLAKDVVSYVRAAYVYFGTKDTAAMHKMNSILGDGYDEKNAPILSGSATAPSTGLTGVTFILNSTPAIRFYISENASEYEFFAGGEKLGVKPGIDSNGNYLEMDVYAYAMAQTITYTLGGDEAGSYHINSYYTFVTTDEEYKNDTALVNLVARFARYCESAAEYRASAAK